MGEKFAANPVTGTGSMNVPIAASPGRSGFGPQLSLSYDSGAGNGPFGFGWSLSLPSITRKTDKGLPQYEDADESDVFILSGAEDLVPVLKEVNGQWQPEEQTRTVGATVDPKEYRVQRYQPRTEGLFARIERWTNNANPADTFWRSISKNNITTWYGRTGESRISDPTESTRVFSWLISESHDDKGNVIVYRYKAENSDNLDLSQAHERNRTRNANRYLKRIRYGNHSPYYPKFSEPEPWPAPPGASAVDGSEDWFFEVVFDYGEHHPEHPTPTDPGGWSRRNDPFSSYRAGFEVRTYRLCQRVLMFHHFEGESGGGRDCLVRSTDFTYSYEQDPTSAANSIYSFLLSVKHTGYKRQPGATYLERSLPPLEFEYSKPTVDKTVWEVDPESLENLPSGLDGTDREWVDLDGEGLSGILTKQAGSWYYKRNLSPLPADPPHDSNGKNGTARFGPLELVARQPSLATVGGSQQFLDLAGDGQLDLVEFQAPTPGFYERTYDEGWESFAPFDSLPVLDWNNPNLKFVDLTGDGHADILVSEDEVFRWYPSLAESGFAPPQRVHKALDEEKGPRLVFADGTQSIYLSDMSGDGLTDLVRIRNGEACYWPNLGYGRFGVKVTMDNAPWFDHPDLFDQRRVSLADIDGSGTTDIIYLGHDGATLYFNQSGNSWSAGRSITAFPSTNNIASVAVLDLLGTGTACLVWSSPLPADARRPMRYIDLMREGKPHLLIGVKNNLGAETRVRYAPSTRFYLQDRSEGRPWITRLPFPVHVVERVETYDRISNNRFVSRYAYHHGYFDGIEREFRGFGMVEQWDTDEIGSVPDQETSSLATNLDAASPPIRTRTWFHTGAYLEGAKVSQHFAHEYYGAPKESEAGFAQNWAAFEASLLPDTLLLPNLTVEEEREASRALKGSMLRQEVYADDAPQGASEQIRKRAETPYAVTEQNFTIERLQSKAGNRHGVFFVHPREAITDHYERNPDDPRVSHTLTLEVDPFGNVLKQAAVGYGRRDTITVVDEQGHAQHIANPGLPELESDQLKQTTSLVTFTENSLTNAVLEADAYRAPLPCETRTYELTGYMPTGPAGRFQASDFVKLSVTAPGQIKLMHVFDDELGYEETPPPQRQRRPIEHVRTLYRSNTLQGALQLGQMGSLALPFETYKLALTPGLLAQIYGRPQAAPPGPQRENLLPNPAVVLPVDPSGAQFADRGGYVDLDGNGNWWVPSGKVFFDPNANPQNPVATAPQELATARAHFFLPRKFTDPFGHGAIVDYDGHDLLISKTVDALANTVVATNDYRVLQPALVTDPNNNQTAVVFDALGMVVATAIVGKAGDLSGDSLAGFEAPTPGTAPPPFGTDLTTCETIDFGNVPRSVAAQCLKYATTRIVYDLHRFRRCGQPPFAGTLARETHVNQPLPPHGFRPQISFIYSDGFGRGVQTKVQAEPGLEPLRLPEENIGLPCVDRIPGALINDGDSPIWSDSRWVGTGRKVYNNKGKPIKQYEPFFSGTHLYEDEPEMTETGVTPILFYDPLDRAVATLHPNHTWEKVVFDPWQQTTYDVSDTVLNADGSTDPKLDGDVKGFFERLPDKDYSPTWYERRTDATKALEEWPDIHPVSGDSIPENVAIRASEKRAAEKAAVHRQTPTVAHLDTRGRTFLTIAHNKFQRKDNGNVLTIEEKHETRIVLDIEGNQREVIDAKGRIVMRYDYDMLGNRIHQASMEAGERWMLNDVTGKPIRAWDSRGHNVRTEYDKLRRPTGLYVTENGVKRLAERTVYGESQGAAGNHRTRVYQVFDAAGVVTSEAYDFKGNLLSSTRRLVKDYKALQDWSGSPLLEPEVFMSSTTYDALNRPIAVTAPDKSVYRPSFSEANLLDKVEVNLRGATLATPFVTNIDYNARGRRTVIHHGNGAETTYEYDDQTFRLVRMKTTRGAGQNGLASQIFKSAETVQDLRYTYDPAGNITRIEDAALLTIFHDSQQVEPVCDYTYDAVYRLIEASGREHIGQTAFDFDPPNCRDYPFVGYAHPNDLQALRRYTERYEYDAVGNFDVMRHVANGGSWTRTYAYNEPSLIELTKHSNRLNSTTIAQRTEPYTYDAHGNITGMPHLTLMQCDFKDQLRATSRQAVNSGIAETTYYVYDAAGQRVRKVTERQDGTRKDERIYLGGFEVYREYNGNGRTVTLERETLHVMDDKQRIAVLQTKTIGGGNPVSVPIPVQRYQLGNHLGSPSLELEKDGGLVSYEEHHPYGTTAYQAINTNADVSLKRYRYTGKERDEESGLYYHGARYYAPWLGRWTAADPIGIRGGNNLFAYVAGNPVRLHDPGGTDPKTTYLGSSKDDKYVARLEKTWGGNQYWSDTGEHGAGWYVRTEGSKVLHAPGVVTLSPVTIEGMPTPIEVAETVVTKTSAEVQARADESGLSYEGRLWYDKGIGKLQLRDIRGFGKGLVNAPGATVEGIANLFGAGIQIPKVLDYADDERVGGWFGEGVGPGPLEVLGAVKAAGKIAGVLDKTSDVLRAGAKAAQSEGLVTKLLDGQRFLGGDCARAAKDTAKKLGLPTETLVEGSKPGIFAVHSRFPQMGGEQHFAVRLPDGRIVDRSLLGNIETFRNARLPAAERAALEGVDTFTEEQYADLLNKYF